MECFGTAAGRCLEPGTLRFLPMAADSDEAERDERAAGSALACSGDIRSLSGFRLSGHLGQVLSHRGDLWLRQAPGVAGAVPAFEAVLRLRTRGASLPRGEARRCLVGRPGPMGLTTEVWHEVPMIEFPRVLRMMVSGSAVEDADHDEPDESVVVHC